MATATTPTIPQTAKPWARALARLGGMRSDLIDDLPQSRGAYINTAAAMLAVGALATASMAYALKSTRVAPAWAAVVAGLGWGAVIVIVDRVLVTSMGRHPRGGWRNVAGATANFLLRLAMALVIGAVVSMPLVLKIYQPEVTAQVQADIAEQRTAAARKLDADFARIPELEAQAAALGEQLDALPFYDPAEVNPAYAEALAARDAAVAACEAANGEAAGEAAGSSGTRRSGYGDEWARLSGVAGEKCAASTHAERVFAEIAAATESQYQEATGAAKARAEAELGRLGAELDLLRADRAAEEAKLDAAVNASDGLAARLQGLDNLARAHPGVWWARLGLMVMIMLVEVMPVFSRYVRVLTAWDLPGALERRRDHAHLESEDIYQAGRAKAVQIRAGIQTQAARDWAAKRLTAEREINSRAVAAEKGVQLERLDAWAATERAKSAHAVAAARGSLAEAARQAQVALVRPGAGGAVPPGLSRTAPQPPPMPRG
ncbi:MAG: DUF4407 domain-containing protein [Bifidobacteriaceae bacterium]|jgi:hypothetical protein|nr:DUF4407 domain-containing protein [Bifidobacteriaceae bacterium]